ncbi:MAG: hypothetical protein CEN87_10 [Parcubacteria group bacterium Licking1014_1]|nr:MAG: hypothetical protein CEN87_10 [Parcubacteria group bacterium Licking1014_1]
MDLTSLKTIKELLLKYSVHLSKRMGQNFLVNKNVLEKIIKTADLKPDDIVLEVGPGIGTLTQELAKTAGKIITVEKDRKMVEILNETLNENINNSCAKKSTIIDFLTQLKNVEIINSDILKISNFKFQISNYKVVANLPYYIASPVIRKFLETKTPPEIMVLMLQKEVAQRICAKPPKMSLLAVSVQFYAKPEIISYVSKNCFWPSPKVDSAIIKITPASFRRGPTSIQLDRGRASNQLFFDIVKAGFSQPRKQLINNLSKTLKLDKKKTNDWLLKNKINSTQRAETLSIEDWQNLTKTFPKI